VAADSPVVPHHDLDRRRFLAGIGLASGSLAVASWLLAEGPPVITKEVVAEAEKLLAVELTEPEREMMVEGLGRLRDDFAKIRAVTLSNDVAPALRFTPLPPAHTQQPATKKRRSKPAALPEVPSDLEELAFAPVTALSQLLEARKVSSLALTEMYLGRLKRFDPLLHCVVTLTEERALAQARQADREIAAGRRRGPLHGVPWGAKDLFAVKGYPTTWGAEPYREQAIDEDATVVRRLDEAGAVLIAKLTLGALAMGDVWFGGKTRNPWNPEDGSSGSSAGSSAAVAAGLVGFALGTETRGSIVSPCTRCGATGLRPTFGRVSRHGAMALAWSMDKVGTIARCVEDCALVFAAIHGPDGRDDVVDAPFAWGPSVDVRALKLGVLQSAFDAEPEKGQEQERAADRAALEALRSLGLQLVPIELPDLPVNALSFILTVEAAAAFDELTRSGKDDLLARQDKDAWPNLFRTARLIPAVEYVQANRVRTLLQRQTERAIAGLDGWVAPSFGNPTLRLTNLTGHPAVVLPHGFRENGTPMSLTFTGALYGEVRLLALAKAYQDATGFHLRHPMLTAPPSA
jgi:Asp-tRNA(Asn)/Glu-tRNA(Gln) amidotransferase A subunit family amidase